MKNNLICFLFLIGTSLFFSCEKEEDALINELTGKWRIDYYSDYETLEIQSNKFIKKHYWLSYNNEEKLIQIIEGNYFIKNQRFITTSAKLTYFSEIPGNETLEQFIYLYKEYNISIINKSLILKPLEVFQPLENNIIGTRFGKWKSNPTLVLVYSIYYEEKYLIGTSDIFIEMPINNNVCYAQQILKYGNKEFISPIANTSYNINNGIITTENFYTFKISYSDDKMIWEHEPINYIRQ